MELTSAGEIFLRHARSSLRQDDRVRSELDALKGLRRGTINMQAIESLVPSVLPRVILGFSARHPGITFNVTGPLIWLDENGEPDGTFDVFDYITLCREHYDKVGIGSAYIDNLIR